MENLKKYNEIFMENFEIQDESVLADNPTVLTLENWDSIAQMNLITRLEETFEIMMDPEDIVGLTSYQKGLEILSRYGVTEV